MGNNRGVKQAVFLSVSIVVIVCTAAVAMDRYDRTIRAVPDRDVKDDGALVERSEIDLMCGAEGGGARVDDPCPLIESLEVSCDLERSRLRATVFSDLPPCTRLRLVADDAFYRDTRVFRHGRARAVWRFPMPGVHEVCIDGCDICATVSCGCATDADCDDGLYCNGQETCNIETAECVAGEYPCVEGEVCNEDNDVCEPDPGEWIERNVGGPSPWPRSDHAMAYDSSRGVTVLFGGMDANTVLGDTWEWDGDTWTLVDAGDSNGVDAPSARADHHMVYFEEDDVMVLFGGTCFGGTCSFDDTWEWDGDNWTLVSDTGPSARWGHSRASAHSWVR